MRLARVFQDPMKGTASSMTIAENMLLAELMRQNRGEAAPRPERPPGCEAYREHLSYCLAWA
jgi:putative ABC transport system ATP-binding protein